MSAAARYAPWCGVKDDVIKFLGGLPITKQLRELIKGGYFYRAGARKLLFHAVKCRFREDATIGSNHPLTIVMGCCFGIMLTASRRDTGYGSWFLSQWDSHTSSRLEAGSVLTSKTRLACIGQRDGRGTSERGLA